MAIQSSARFAVAGVAVAVLPLIFTGVLARPLLVVAAWLLVLAVLEARREWRREIRVFARTQQNAAFLIAAVVVGLVGYWASQPFFERRAILNQLAEFSDEGRQLETDFARKLAATNQLQGESTARIQDWQKRVDTWIGEDLGPFYKSRLATPQESPAYPPGMPARLRVFWDILESDIAVIEQFRSELSPWLFGSARSGG